MASINARLDIGGRALQADNIYMREIYRAGVWGAAIFRVSEDSDQSGTTGFATLSFGNSIWGSEGKKGL